ncbi:hypothetical protein HGA91_03745 [candidate division WWE3 bacterium]|nr:hypothetical protein [candidate division WWE3 bacterium]
MSIKQTVTIVLIMTLVAFVGIYVAYYAQPGLTEADAIAKVQQTDPQLQEYPSDSLPPKSIRTKSNGSGWLIQFVQEGSGVPIISAQCFSVDKRGIVTKRGSYDRVKDGEKMDLSFSDCQ